MGTRYEPAVHGNKNIYMKRGFKSFIRNMQIKTTLRYNFHLQDRQKSRNSVAYSNDKTVGKQSHIHYYGSINWYNAYGWQFDNICQNHKIIDFDLTVLLLGI